MYKDGFERKPSVLEETMEELLFGFEYAHPKQEKRCSRNTDRDSSIFLDQSSVIGETVEELIFGFEFAHPERAKAIQERKQLLKTMRSSERTRRDKGRER